jgi:hypothetical protein
MTDRAQFEAMLEALINDDQAAAKEIFHNIVVGKSREIYEELLAEDFSQDSGNPYAKKDEEEVDESEGEEEVAEEKDEESEEEADDAEDDAEDSEEGDDADSEEDPFADDEEGEEDSEEGEGDIEDRVMDLEDALEDLKAEFEQLMASEEAEGHDDLGGEFAAEPEMSAEPEMGMDHEEGDIDELASLMEYVNKVNVPSGGDNGQNTKSAVAGKNDMGGTTANMTKSFSTTSGGTEGGLASTKTQPQDGGNINVPGAKNATKLKAVTAGHGAEKAGKKETADNKQSFLKQAKK